MQSVRCLVAAAVDGAVEGLVPRPPRLPAGVAQFLDGLGHWQGADLESRLPAIIKEV